MLDQDANVWTCLLFQPQKKVLFHFWLGSTGQTPGLSLGLEDIKQAGVISAHVAFKYKSISYISLYFLWRLQFGKDAFNQKNIWFVFLLSLSHFGSFVRRFCLLCWHCCIFCRHIERQPQFLTESKCLYFSRLWESDAPHNQSPRKELNLTAGWWHLTT